MDQITLAIAKSYTDKKIAEGGGSGGTVNTYTKDEIDAKLEDKVDAEEGKGLSTNDFTNEYKAKVEGVVALAAPETLAVNTIYDLGNQTALSLSLPQGSYGDYIQVDFISGDTATNLSITATSMLGDNITPEKNTTYSLYFDYGVLYYDSTTSSYAYGWRFCYSEYPHSSE